LVGDDHLKEAGGKDAGWRTGMPRVWGGRQIRRASWDEPALQGEVSHPSEGSYRKSDNRASKAVGSTPGDLLGLSARTGQGSNPLSKARQESAAGIIARRQARLVRHSKAERRSNR